MTFIASLISMQLSSLFVILNTPLIISALIIAQAILISFSTYNISLTSWFSFILFLVFVRAIIIIFVYVSSLASNDFFNSYTLTMAHNITIIILFFIALYTTSTPICLEIFSKIILADTNLTPTATYKIYTSYTLNISIILITYLLVSLIAVAKISSVLKGPLRLTYSY